MWSDTQRKWNPLPRSPFRPQNRQRSTGESRNRSGHRSSNYVNIRHILPSVSLLERKQVECSHVP